MFKKKFEGIVNGIKKLKRRWVFSQRINKFDIEPVGDEFGLVYYCELCDKKDIFMKVSSEAKALMIADELSKAGMSSISYGICEACK